MACTEESVCVLTVACAVSLNALRKRTETQRLIVSFYREEKFKGRCSKENKKRRV